MQLIPVETLPSIRVIPFLWAMLETRDPKVNISHKRMPTLDEHAKFVLNHPYRCWYIILQNGKWVGNIYLTKENEIGINLVPEARGLGIGTQAVRQLMSKKGPGRYLANISPGNVDSQLFFEFLGFKLIQYTYEMEP